MTTVTDADRKAAAEYGRHRLYSGLGADGILEGRADHDDLVQAFARHREGAEHRARLEGAEIMREAAAKACLATYSSDGHASGDWPTPEECEEAIRNIDPAAILEAHMRAKEEV